MLWVLACGRRPGAGGLIKESNIQSGKSFAAIFLFFHRSQN
jgi:hypothetical protein